MRVWPSAEERGTDSASCRAAGRAVRNLQTFGAAGDEPMISTCHPSSAREVRQSVHSSTNTARRPSGRLSRARRFLA